MKYIFSILLFIFTLSYAFVKAEPLVIDEQTTSTPASDQKVDAQPVVETFEPSMPDTPDISFPEDDDDDSGFLDLDDIPDSDLDE